MSSNVIPFQAVHATRELDDQPESRIDHYLENSLTETNETSSSSYQEGWVISYIDVLTLLLTLFVILFAMTHFNEEAPLTTVIDTAESTLKSSDLMLSKTSINSIQLTTPRSEPSESLRTSGNHEVEPAETEHNRKTTTMDVSSPTLNTEVKLIENEQYLDIASLQSSPAQIDISRILPVNMPPILPAEAVTAGPGEHDAMIDNSQPMTEPASPGSLTEHPQYNALIKQIEQSQIAHQLEVNEIHNKMNLIISDRILFTPASVDLKPEGLALIQQLALMLKQTEWMISVEGHTDNVPINSQQYPSNWELSTARATLVTRYLIEQDIAAQRIRAIGYADTHPRADNTTPTGREHNRRVSIVLSLPE